MRGADDPKGQRFIVQGNATRCAGNRDRNKITFLWMNRTPRRSWPEGPKIHSLTQRRALP